MRPGPPSPWPSGPVVVGSVLEPDAAASLRALAGLPTACGLVELRADQLRADEVGDLVRRTARPLVVTIRREGEGGTFTGSEEERERGLAAALAAGACGIDVEWQSGPAARFLRERPERVLLSHHGTPCALAALTRQRALLADCKAACIKLVPAARALAELSDLRAFLRVVPPDPPLICFASGRPGTLSRLLAPAWGSWASYGAGRPGAETGPGQLTARAMLDTFDVLGLTPRTRLFALVGRPVAASASPAMHRAAYAAAGLDARYLPVELDEPLAPALAALCDLGIEALGVTIPFKEDAATLCRELDRPARLAGAVNTLIRRGAGHWIGINTDGPAVLAALERHAPAADAIVAVVGAGGAGRAAAALLAAAGARVTLFNRSPERGARAAAALGVASRALPALEAFRWDVLVQASPLGGNGEEVLPGARLDGRVVLDFAYGPAPTPLIAQARLRGLATVDGVELLAEQGALQFHHMTGRAADATLMQHAARRWLEQERRALDGAAGPA